ncbi:hypothetical protein FOA43_002355 [Brettanomyces nanus]|uniref:Uncharacterized protein n=1 Tax=Eeniella nana TaxID=13502 RepID=A0A875S3R8_EENNA|nr:uncharacterized protein FOA43_002355 [Brettanomyces nanus]QPG75015.1 hypothetical protein FOA43_002355 [Brettanomyces nanus]
MDYSLFYEDWTLAIAARAQLELVRPFRVVLGFANSLLTGDLFYYPAKGIQLFIEDWQNILPLYISLTFPLVLVQSVLRALCFVLLLPANILVLTITCGPLGLSIALAITNEESISLADLLTSCFLPDSEIKQAKYNALFDHILCLTGNEQIVFPGKLQRVVNNSPTAELFNVSKYIQFWYNLITWNSTKLLPVVGAPLLAYKVFVENVNKRMSRLFRLQRLRKRQVGYYHLKEREGELLALGVSMGILESIPFIGQSFFSFTNTIGLAYMCGKRLNTNLNVLVIPKSVEKK